MNITYIIGVLVAIVVMLLGMANGFPPYDFTKILNFVDGPSVMIVIGCTFAIVVACFPVSMLKSIPGHFKVMLDVKRIPPIILTSWWSWRRRPEKTVCWLWRVWRMTKRTRFLSRRLC